MRHRPAWSLWAIALFAMVVVGCEEPAARPTAPPPTPQSSAATASESETVKSMDEYRTDAAKTVTKENAQTELDKLEKEIAADQ